jgi:hypothetical protein
VNNAGGVFLLSKQLYYGTVLMSGSSIQGVVPIDAVTMLCRSLTPASPLPHRQMC